MRTVALSDSWIASLLDRLLGRAHIRAAFVSLADRLEDALTANARLASDLARAKHTLRTIAEATPTTAAAGRAAACLHDLSAPEPATMTPALPPASRRRDRMLFLLFCVFLVALASCPELAVASTAPARTFALGTDQAVIVKPHDWSGGTALTFELVGTAEGDHLACLGVEVPELDGEAIRAAVQQALDDPRTPTSVYRLLLAVEEVGAEGLQVLAGAVYRQVRCLSPPPPGSRTCENRPLPDGPALRDWLNEVVLGPAAAPNWRAARVIVGSIPDPALVWAHRRAQAAVRGC